MIKLRKIRTAIRTYNEIMMYRSVGKMLYQERKFDPDYIKKFIDLMLEAKGESVSSHKKIKNINIVEAIKREAEESGNNEIFQYASKAIEKLRPVDAQT